MQTIPIPEKRDFNYSRFVPKERLMYRLVLRQPADFLAAVRCLLSFLIFFLFYRMKNLVKNFICFCGSLSITWAIGTCKYNFRRACRFIKIFTGIGIIHIYIYCCGMFFVVAASIYFYCYASNIVRIIAGKNSQSRFLMSGPSA